MKIIAGRESTKDQNPTKDEKMCDIEKYNRRDVSSQSRSTLTASLSTFKFDSSIHKKDCAVINVAGVDQNLNETKKLNFCETLSFF